MNSSTLDKTIEGKFLKIRKAMGLSQGKFTKPLSVHQSNYSHIEIGRRKPTLEFLLELKAVYNVNLNWLLSNDEDDSNMFLDEGNDTQHTKPITNTERQQLIGVFSKAIDILGNNKESEAEAKHGENGYELTHKEENQTKIIKQLEAKKIPKLGVNK